MAVLVPDKKLDRFWAKEIFLPKPNNLAYHPGPVSPPSGDCYPLMPNFNDDLSLLRQFPTPGVAPVVLGVRDIRLHPRLRWAEGLGANPHRSNLTELDLVDLEVS